MYFLIVSGLKVSCGVEESAGDDNYDLLQFESHNLLRKFLPYFHIRNIFRLLFLLQRNWRLG